VWIVSATARTVTVHRPGVRPELLTGTDELDGEPHMPGLRFRVEDIFDD